MRASYFSAGCLLFAAALSLSGCQEGAGPDNQGEILNSGQVSLDGPPLFPKDLGTLGRVFTVPSDINNTGTVVGLSERADFAIHAFRWTDRTGIVDLGTLPGHGFSEAFAVMDDGRIFGSSASGALETITAVMWTAAGEIHPLDIPLLPGSTFNMPADANALGQVVGTTDGGSGSRSWIWSESEGITEIGGGSLFGTLAIAINDRGLVVGLSSFPTFHAFSWTRATGIVDLGPAESPRSIARDVNLFGDIVGSSDRGPPSARLSRPRFWNREGKVHSLQIPEGGFGEAEGINSGGDAVGFAANRNGFGKPTVWWSGGEGGAVRLPALREGFGSAVGINDQRWVIGSLLTAGGTEFHAVLWQPAPDTPPISESAVETTPVSVPAQVMSGPAACYADSSFVTKEALVQCLLRYIRSGGPGSD
jgi:probable HAF family extracellular repeat protein